jgi:hypothetical protein
MRGRRVHVAVRGENENTGVRKFARNESQHQERWIVGSVKIVEDEEDRLRLRRVSEKRGDCLEEATAGSLGVVLERRLKVGKTLSHFGKQARQFGASDGERRSQIAIANLADERAQRLHPRPVRGCAASFPRPPDENARATSARRLRELLGEAALTDPWFARNKEHPSVTGERRLKARVQGR